jgi:hypothetical protein
VKVIKNKKIIYFLCFCVFDLLFIMTSAFSYFPKAQILAVSVPKVSIYSNNIKDGYVKNIDYTSVSLYIESDIAPTSDIEVYYRTYDETAIAKSGDYTSTDTYVILTPTSYHKEITISTKIAGFNVTYLGGDNLRTFGVEIYKVDGNAEIDSSKNSIRCALREMAEIGAINKNGVITLNDYVEGSTQNISESQTFYDETPNFVKISETSSSLYTKLNFIYSYENLADMYFSASGILDESASYWTASESWPFVVRFSYSDISDGNTLYQSGYYNLDNSTVYLGKNSSDYGIKDVYEYVDKRQIVVARNNVDSGNYYYMRNNDLIISLMSNTGRDRTFNNWKTEFIMFDKTTPTISSYYIEPIISSKKIRLAIRFSEPIHTDNPSSLQLNAYPNGTNNATSNLHFNYVGGNFTDTLYFDCDMSSYNYQTNISYLQFSTQNGFNSIYDFAYDENGRNYQFHSSDISLVNKFDCSYDTRTPVITTSSTSLSTVSKNHIVGVTTQKMDNSGYVEYTWTNSTDVPSSYDNKNIVTPTNFSINPQNFTGTYYLHLKATSAYGKSSQDVCIGPANFDNSSPTISNLVVPDASYSLDKRNITFNIEDIGLAGINNITLEYSKVYSSETKTLIIYSSSSSTNKVTLTSNQAEFLLTATDLGLGTNEYADYNLKIYADDKVGNVSAIISANSVKFDTRSLNSQVTMTPGQSEYFSNGNVKVYALNSHFDFELTNGSATELIPNVIYNGNVVSTNEYFTSTTSTNTVSITPTKSGLYEISLCVVVGTETSYTTSYQFYIYQDNDVTGNKSNLDNFNVLINKLYKLDSVKYYYKDKNGIVVSENYFNTSINYFSTYDKLFNYVYYYELQDLYAYEIPTDSVASSFNSNSSEYRKADGESISASKGQVWIRYKRSGWDSSSQTGDWVYYFYSNSNNNEISTSLISSNLQLALYTVSTKIASKGVITYLTSYDGLDSYGSPKVSSSEIHPIDENISKTKTGQLYSNSISFIGDSDIYLSTIESLGKTLKYATGYTFVSNNYTHLYYGSYDGNEVLNDNYIEIQNFDGARLSSIINGTGIYEILEVDDKGMSKFLVYVDNSAPSIEVNYSRLDGTSENNFVIGKESDNTTLNVATLSLQKIINEIDPLSYIAVFNSSYYSLYGVYSNEDLTSSEVALPQGRWYIEIYDRAGNHFVINVRINNTTLNCSYVLRQNVSITFKCDRTENDIFSYQIWRDNVLIQSNYTNDITFKTTGTYHIRVEDWYGNIYDKEVSLSRVSPESNLSWKYENGTTYYDYDSTNPTGMKLTKLGTNKYSVTSSGNLQIIYDSSCDYSYKVEGDATITSSTNVGKVRISNYHR